VTRAVARDLADACTAPRVVEGAAAIRLAGVCRRLSEVLQLWLHGKRRTGRSIGLQVHRCSGATLDMTESTCWPHPLQVVFPQRPQRAGLHMWCSSG
jgi:hypothetical protein